MIGSSAHVATWLIAAFVITGVIVRPWGLPEALWAILGAAALVLCALMPLSSAWLAVRRGTDVYLFLTGMMLLAELARHAGLFDWLAALAVQRSRGSPTRLFFMVYGVGALVTVFLSNDATAVVLTPAVYAAAIRAKVKPMPYLFACAFIANAASFVLPISNPANLVVYGTNLPSLVGWLRTFGIASLCSILVTFAAMRFMHRADLRGEAACELHQPALTSGGRLAAGGIGATAMVLLVASSLDWSLGLPTFLSGVLTTTAILVVKRTSPLTIVKQISWSILPLVAGLFVLVAAIEATGLLEPVSVMLPVAAAAQPKATLFGAGVFAGFLCNLINNLPLGLLVGSVTNGVQLTPELTGSLLIGVDLGPNLSVTGSLATILWLVALRREGQAVSAWTFLKVGSVVMPVALLAALAGFIWLKV